VQPALSEFEGKGATAKRVDCSLISSCVIVSGLVEAVATANTNTTSTVKNNMSTVGPDEAEAEAKVAEAKLEVEAAEAKVAEAKLEYRSEKDEGAKEIYLSAWKSAQQEVESLQTVLAAVRGSFAASLNSPTGMLRCCFVNCASAAHRSEVDAVPSRLLVEFIQ